MKVYKITLCYIDFNGIGDEDVQIMIENGRLQTEVMEMQSVDIGEWKDDNPLNNRKTSKEAFNKLFQTVTE